MTKEEYDNKTEVKIYKLVSGEEIITRWIEWDDKLTLTNTYKISIIEEGEQKGFPSFMPFPLHKGLEVDEVVLHKRHIILEYYPEPTLLEMYLQYDKQIQLQIKKYLEEEKRKNSAGLILPEEKKIIH